MHRSHNATRRGSRPETVSRQNTAAAGSKDAELSLVLGLASPLPLASLCLVPKTGAPASSESVARLCASAKFGPGEQIPLPPIWLQPVRKDCSPPEPGHGLL